MRPLDQQHHHHPGTCQKCKFSAPSHTCSVQTPGGSSSDCALRSLPGDSDTCPCPALPPLPDISAPPPTRFGFPCALRRRPQRPHLFSRPPHHLTTFSQVCPTASQRQPATVPAGPCSSLQDPSPHLNGLSEGTSAHTHTHWPPVSTPHEKPCSAKDDSHLREVLSAPTCFTYLSTFDGHQLHTAEHQPQSRWTDDTIQLNSKSHTPRRTSKIMGPQFKCKCAVCSSRSMSCGTGVWVGEGECQALPGAPQPSPDPEPSLPA